MFRRNKTPEDISDLQQKPLIVSGTGRSGTSILLGAMAAHPDVHNGPEQKGEAPFITHFMQFLVDVDNAPYGPYVNRNYRSGIEKKNEIFINMLRDINSPAAYQNDSAKFWPAKCGLNEEQFLKLQELTDGFPLVKIHRNPISVIDSSLHFHGFEHLSFEQICRRWIKGNKEMDFFRSQANTYVVAYEDLVKDADATFKSIQETIGLRHSDKPAEFFKKTKINSAYKSKKKPSIEQRWDSWTKEQQKEMIDLCGDLMEELGYDVPKVKSKKAKK